MDAGLPPCLSSLVCNLKIRRVLTIVASFAVTAVFLALALYPVNFAQLGQAFASADYRLVVVAGCFTFAGYVLRTKRWQRFLAPSKKIPVVRLFPVLVIGFALNNLLPGRPGEFARPYALGRRESLSKTLGFATVVVERVADGVALIGILLLTLGAFIPLHLRLPEVAEGIAALATAVFGVALAGLLFLLLRESLALAMFHRLEHWMPHGLATRLEKMLGSFTIGLHSLKSPNDVLAIAVLSLAVWACEGTAYFLVLSAFGEFDFLPERMVAAAFMMVLINLGIMIPAAPGGLGPFEAAAVFALGAFGVNETTAASVALTAHAVQYLIITGLGLLFIWREGISLAQARPDDDESPSIVQSDG
ncbi:MAG: lysylphosphatidylglycerol synthase transmembrane domain-containing protein [Acidobacteriota bacterium]